jgi:MarR family transcriptional regulator, organic hydroperoxide resistance regulator
MYRLTTSLPYLLNRVGVRLGLLFTQRIAPHGITLPMYRVLAALHEQPDQKLGELSAMTSIDLSTMSRLIGAMVRMKLVSRVRMPGDERTVRINLRPAGVKLGARLMREAQHYEEVAIATLKAADLARLKADLAKVYGALDLLQLELDAGRQPRAGKLRTSRRLKTTAG